MKTASFDQTKFDLYRHYIKELADFDPALSKYSDWEIKSWIICYMTDDNSCWLEIKNHSGEDIGFAIICNHDNIYDCHPDADYTIAQAYIKPEYRRRGLMTDCIIAYIHDHPGIYAYDVIKGNTGADRFWKNLFEKKLDAIQYKLPEVRPVQKSSVFDLHGYKVLDGKRWIRNEQSTNR